MKPYKLTEGGLQWQFQQSRAKIQIFGGGFGNGKTTAGVIKALQLAKDYPGSNGLIARSTYPKLNDTIRKEFLNWCPSTWIKRKVLSGADNMVELENGSVINFRYVQQSGKGGESSTSNLLSATYDWIVVDQIEDPEITEKDFLDLLGRLRGSAAYNGTDPTMPLTGPRWLIGLCNPTRNWVYRKLVKPLQDYKKGIFNADLMLDPNTQEPLIELFEGSTYTNKENLASDFIETLETAYKGQMRERFLLGQWGAFEGLVYPQYDASVHGVERKQIEDYLLQLITDGFAPSVIEAYDHGMASPSCYGLGFTDHLNNTFLLDGHYEAECSVERMAKIINEKRKRMFDLIGYELELRPILADPAIFRRGTGSAQQVGKTVASLYREEDIQMTRANNDIVSGIAKVQSYIAIDTYHTNPLTGNMGAPRFYHNRELTWFESEITDYYWKKDGAGEYEDKPNDRKDHAMDMTKYFFTHRPKVAVFIKKIEKLPPKFLRWGEVEAVTRHSRSHRHAA
jgi:phage terminase large subunit